MPWCTPGSIRPRRKKLMCTERAIYPCTSECSPQLCRTCSLSPPYTVVKMVPFPHTPLVHTPFRLQPDRGLLTSSMYLVATLRVDMCESSRLRFGLVMPSTFLLLLSNMFADVLSRTPPDSLLIQTGLSRRDLRPLTIES